MPARTIPPDLPGAEGRHVGDSPWQLFDESLILEQVSDTRGVFATAAFPPGLPGGWWRSWTKTITTST
jgi:hypothetical protein